MAVACALAGAVACGDDSPAADAASFPDASDPDADTTDATPTGCEELAFPAGAIDSYPGSYTGDLTDSTADLELLPGQCAVEDAPFGVAVPGPDQVIELTGLAPGTRYVVRLASAADYAFYVATGCSAGSSPGEDECLLFVDAQVDLSERGAFAAPATGIAFVVVDQYMNAPHPDPTFTVEVAEAECADDDQCAAPTPYCVGELCHACRTKFDCADAAAPVCDVDAAECTSGFDDCTGDDPSPAENGDDGPAGATDLSTSATGHVCSAPADEVDYYRVTAADGEGLAFTLTWDDAAANLDLAVVDAAGVVYGLSFHQRPESIALTFLPAGTYFASVRKFELDPTAAATEYTLEVARTTGSVCATAADCATEYDNQIYRGACDTGSGACEPIAGAGAVAVGGACDTADDCVPEAELCTAFSFTPNLDTRGSCAAACTGDGECDPGQVCMTHSGGGFCSLPCAADVDCPVLVASEPAPTEPWAHFSCDAKTGKCAL
jgi:hypothetical protein